MRIKKPDWQIDRIFQRFCLISPFWGNFFYQKNQRRNICLMMTNIQRTIVRLEHGEP